MIMSKFAPRAGGGSRCRRSSKFKSSRPMSMDTCSSRGCSNGGGSGGSSGSFCRSARKLGAGAEGGSRRYHGIASSAPEEGGGSVSGSVRFATPCGESSSPLLLC